jgi:predicted TIM-barrel fold metal-dependent hydrolase
MIEGGYVSADAHVVEPGYLWSQRMDKKFRDEAPHIEARPDGDYYVIKGIEDFPVSLEGATIEDKIKGEIDKISGYRQSDTRPGAWDPIARRADMDLDNIRAEIVYPGLFGLQFSYAPDPEYRLACMQVYKDWLSEFCAAMPDRLIGAALLPMGGPIELTIKEAERAAKMGLRSFLIPARNEERPYSSPEYDRLWAALEDIGLPIGTHAGTGTRETLFAKFRRMGMGPAVTDSKITMPMQAMTDLIWFGVPQRYPKLRFVIVEGGIGWIASVLRFMDHWWTDHHRWMRPQLAEPPSFYFKHHFWATFEDDRPGLLTRELIGVDRLMWGSDYPHTEGTFPHSREQVAKDFAGISEHEIRMLVADNAARLYGIG